ncbi:MAG TPA: dipeptidase [Gaiellaceae bacterium]|nr:dipeptidase [Gaiellaceae bacterium]
MIPVVDGHNDALLRVWRNGRSLRERDEEGCLDLPRMREGGIVAGFFAIFVPAQDTEPADPRSLVVPTADGYEVPVEQPLPFERAVRVADELAAIAARDLDLVRAVAELERCVGGGPGPGAILHLEGAEPIEPGLGNLEAWLERGLRSVGIVWSRPNAFGHGVPFRFPGTPDTGPGLTPAGRELVRACNELGVMLDVAHLNLAGFRDVARLSDRPLVSTHGGVHARCPIPRSLVDEELDAIRDSGGVAGIVFDSVMTRADGDLVDDTPLDTILDHVDYVAERIGVEHVAIGSDFDGAHPPHALADATRTQVLLEGLRARGWSEDELRAFGHGNWLRVLGDTWL